MPKNDRQREHQANERTFLAWLRTAISLVAFGLAIARFGLFLRKLQAAVTHQEVPTPAIFSSESLGTGLIIVGIIAIGLAVWHYNRTYWQIERGDYQPNRLLVWVTAGIVSVLAFLAIPFVIWRQPRVSHPSSKSQTAPAERQLDQMSSALGQNRQRQTQL